MGYDVECVSELPIRNEDVEKARELVEKYHESMEDKEYFKPGIRPYGSHYELVLYDLTEGDDVVVGSLHNDTLYELLDPVIRYLKENGVPITGWLFQNYEGTEVSTTIYKDGKELGYLNECGLSRMCLKYILNDGGKIDFKLINHTVLEG